VAVSVGGSMKEPNMKSPKIPHLVFMLKNTAKKALLLRIMVLLQRCGSSQLHAMGNWLPQWKKYILEVKYGLLFSVSKVTD
jgi:hypothetical protein